MGKHAKMKERQKWSNEKLHLENGRKLRGIYFIDLEDKEFKETIKNARKKLLWILCSIYRTRIISITNDSGKSHGYHFQTAGVVQDKKRTQYLLNTQVKMEDAPKLLKIPKSECPDIWIRLPRHKWPKSWSSMEDPVVPLERNLYGHPLAGLLWERQFEKVLL